MGHDQCCVAAQAVACWLASPCFDEVKILSAGGMGWQCGDPSRFACVSVLLAGVGHVGRFLTMLVIDRSM